MSTATIDAPPLTEEVITGADDDAPYGRFKNGKPRKNPPKGEAAPKRGPAKKAAKGSTDYRPGIMGMLQLVGFGVSFASPVDAVSIMDHGPNIAEAVNNTAQRDVRMAAALDRILQAGPYAEIIAATVPLVMQVLHNHDRVPEAAVIQMGGRPKREILAEMDRAA